jgi:hypothetical protein
MNRSKSRARLTAPEGGGEKYLGMGRASCQNHECLDLRPISNFTVKSDPF